MTTVTDSIGQTPSLLERYLVYTVVAMDKPVIGFYLQIVCDVGIDFSVYNLNSAGRTQFRVFEIQNIKYLSRNIYNTEIRQCWKICSVGQKKSDCF